jgi:hypothetical protein
MRVSGAWSVERGPCPTKGSCHECCRPHIMYLYVHYSVLYIKMIVSKMHATGEQEQGFFSINERTIPDRECLLVCPLVCSLLTDTTYLLYNSAFLLVIYARTIQDSSWLRTSEPLSRDIERHSCRFRDCPGIYPRKIREALFEIFKKCHTWVEWIYSYRYILSWNALEMRCNPPRLDL